MKLVTPPVCYKIDDIEDSNGRGTIERNKVVLVVRIEESHVGPHMAQERYFFRLGAHSHPAPHYIVEALWAKRHYSKPRLTHLIRHAPDNPEAIQIGLIALTDYPAIDVQLSMQPLPGLYRDTNCAEFPVTIGVIDKHTPFFFEVTTRYDAEHHRDEEFDVEVDYSDLAANRYTHKSRVNLFRALPSLRSGRKGLNEIADSLKSIASHLIRTDWSPPLPPDL